MTGVTPRGANEVRAMNDWRTTISRNRRWAGMTQRQLAAEIGVSETSIWKWENGEAYPSAWLVVRRLAEVLDLTGDEVLALQSIEQREAV